MVPAVYRSMRARVTTDDWGQLLETLEQNIERTGLPNSETHWFLTVVLMFKIENFQFIKKIFAVFLHFLIYMYVK